MARRSHKTTRRGDWQAYTEMTQLPTRESLAPGKKGPQTHTVNHPASFGSYSQSVTTDDRTEDEIAKQNAWDAKAKEISARKDARAKATKEQQKRDMLREAQGLPPEHQERVQKETAARSEAERVAAQKKEDKKPENPLNNGKPIQKPEETPDKKTEAAPKPSVNNVIIPANGEVSSQIISQVDGATIDRSQTEQRNMVSGRMHEIASKHARNYADERAAEDSKRFQDRMVRLTKLENQFHSNMKEARYRSGVLENASDWENLGRRTNADGTAIAVAQGMEKGGTEYQKRLQALTKQAHGINQAVKDGLISREKATALVKLFHDSQMSDQGLTVKQMDALGKQFTDWQAGADKKRAFVKERQDFFAEREARKMLGDRANGLGQQAAIALASGLKTDANMAAVTALRDPKLSADDRMKHQKTLMDNGIDTIALGREAVEQAMKGLGGKDDANARKVSNRFQEAMKAEGATADSVYEMFGNDIVFHNKGNMDGKQVGSNGVQLRPSEKFANNYHANNDAAKVDGIIGMLDDFKKKDSVALDQKRFDQGDLTGPVELNPKTPGAEPSDMNARTYFDTPDTGALEPKKRR